MKFTSAELKYVVVPESSVKKYSFPNVKEDQIVFIGRSNVGKSSVINKLTGFSKLARTSSEPGKTRQINYYLINEKFYFVDLPGYGFAKISGSMRKSWEQLIEQYFYYNREKIKLGNIIIDIRHGPMDLDMLMIDFLDKEKIPYLLVLNKVDKLNRSEMMSRIHIYEKLISGKMFCNQIVPYSCVSGIGKKELLKIIEYFID